MCSFHETKANKKKRKRQNKEPKESKKERQEGRKKEKNKTERQRKRMWKRGRQKRRRINKGRHLKINRNALSRGKIRFFYKSKQRKGTQKKGKKGGFRAKWVALWTFWENTKKLTFQLSATFSILVGVQNFHFWTTWSKQRAPKKILWRYGFQQPIFWKTDLRHETAIFGPKNQNQQFQLSFIFAFSSLSTTKTQKLLKHLFLSVLAILKKMIFRIQTKNKENKKLCLYLFLEKALFRKLPDNWGPPKHKFITGLAKIAWNHYKYKPKISLDQLITLI